ncbi:MAG: hypothetical protein KUG79_01655 [Pseudomonadales bacterium]|nr:hypothetical protein [Pseudomonadales bacterium]
MCHLFDNFSQLKLFSWLTVLLFSGGLLVVTTMMAMAEQKTVVATESVDVFVERLLY